MNIAILLAGGIGERMSSHVPKQFLKLNEKYLFEYSLKTFLEVKEVDYILLIIQEKYNMFIKNILRKYSSKKIMLCNGGENRKQSLEKAIKIINHLYKDQEENINVITHDVVRPLVDKKIVQEHIQKLKNNALAVNTIVNINDSIVKVNKNKTTDYPNRSSYCFVQTPQSFKLKTYNNLVKDFKKEVEITDVMKLFYLNNVEIVNVNGSWKNFKITTWNDYYYAQFLIKNKVNLKK